MWQQAGDLPTNIDVESSIDLVTPPSCKTNGFKVLFVNECTPDTTWTRVQVLVCTPASKVDVPIVELQRYIADGVREIPTNNTALMISEVRTEALY